MFAQAESLIVAHLDLTDTPNEIPLVQALLQDMGLTNCVFTVDALHCQEDTLKAAKDSPNEVIVPVKANQPNVLKDCQRTAETSQVEDVYQEPVTKAHGRIESRQVSEISSHKFKLAKALVECQTFQTIEVSLFNLTMSH